jgi:hypothetical protein
VDAAGRNLHEAGHAKVEALLPRAASADPVERLHLDFVCGSTCRPKFLRSSGSTAAPSTW